MADAVPALDTVLARRTAAGPPEVYTAVANVTSIKPPGVKRPKVKTTNLSSTRQTNRVGLPEDQPVTLTINYDPDSAGHQALLASVDSGTLEHWKVTFHDSTFTLFTGYLTGFEPNAGGEDENLTADIEITPDGAAPTWPS